MRTWILLLLCSIASLFADDDLEILPSSSEHIATFALKKHASHLEITFKTQYQGF